MRKIAIVLYGPPGAGKGTQANLLATRMNLIHFDTGKFLENLVHDPAKQQSKEIMRERRFFDSGILLTPSWVLKVTVREAQEIRKAGFGVVFSGSPRTLFEARGLVPELTRLYGKKNIFAFVIDVPAKVSAKRNSARMICKFCGYALLTAYYSGTAKHCPVCAGGFYKRSLDNPKTIVKRLKEYAERTEPIFDFMKQHGINPKTINGTLPPYRVFEQIVKIVK